MQPAPGATRSFPMAINPSKTVCMTIGPQRKLSKLIELSLSVQSITLQSVETHRSPFRQESYLEYPY